MIYKGTKKSNGLKIAVIMLVAVGFSFNANAQQDPYFTHYMFNKLQYNPATAGEKEKICFAGIFHTQWTGYDDNTFEYWPDEGGESTTKNSGVGPKTFGIQVSAPIADLSDKMKLGAGFSIVQDDVGYETALKARVAVSGTYTFDNGSSLALGVDLGLLQKGVDGSDFFFHDKPDPNIQNNKKQAGKFNVAAGLYYLNPMWSDFYMGVSSTNINEQNFNISSNLTLKSARHYYAVAGLAKKNFLGNPNLTLHPSILVKTANITQVTVTGLAEYADLYWGGLAYRSTVDALSIMLGYNVNQDLRIGYSYDITLSQLGKYSGGSHELQINYCMMPKINTEKTKFNELTPRFLNKNPLID